jgi:uncharacterized protein (TIGR02598 family)
MLYFANMKRRGLSVLEVIISLTILGLVVIFLLNLLPSSLALVYQAETRQKASRLARTILDQHAALPFTQLVVGSSVTFAYDPFGGTFTVNNITNSDPTYLLDLQVEVQWRDGPILRSITQDLWVHKPRT